MVLNCVFKVLAKCLFAVLLLILPSNFLFSNQKTNQNPIFNGVDRIIVEGMSRSDFIDACAINWKPLEKPDQKWESVEIDLNKHIHYSDFETIISKLIISDIAMAYKADKTTADGRPFFSVEIGRGSKLVTFSAGIHAREVANPQFLLKFATILVNAYESGNPKYVDLLNKCKVVFLSCANPDGYEAALLGKNAISNQSLFLSQVNDDDVFKSKSNANGVDINRNFPSYSASVLWSAETQSQNYIDSVPSINYFSGHKLGSEIETRVSMNFIMRYVPISIRFIDLHSAGRLVYAGKPHLSNSFNDQCMTVASIVNAITKYKIRGLSSEDVGKGTDGTITDFAAEVAAGFAFNDALGRIAPLNADSLISKTECYDYKCSVNTIETLRTSKREGYGLIRTSTAKMQSEEWKIHKLEDLFFALIDVK